MAKIDKRIEIVVQRGGRVDDTSQTPLTEMLRILRMTYQNVGVSYVSGTSDLKKLGLDSGDLALLRIKRLRGASDNIADRVWASDEFDAREINYSGSQSYAFSLEFSKHKAKSVIAAAGLNTADFFVANQAFRTNDSSRSLDFPLFLKPDTLGSSRGISSDSVVHDDLSLNNKIDAIRDSWGGDTIVESYLEGREFSVALLHDNDTGISHVMPIEIVAPKNSSGDRILSNTTKRANSEKVLNVEQSPLREALKSLALSSFNRLEGRDYARIDMRLDDKGNPSFMEANFLPGLGFTGYFARACQINMGWDYEEVLQRLVASCLARPMLENSPSIKMGTYPRS